MINTFAICPTKLKKLKLSHGRLCFQPYDPIFIQLFEAGKERLLKFLGKQYPIEHIGSTAVPNLGGKGVTDICIIVPKKEQEKVW